MPEITRRGFIGTAAAAAMTAALAGCSSTSQAASSNSGAASASASSASAESSGAAGGAMTLVILRHGESEWNKDNLFTGWTDVALIACPFHSLCEPQCFYALSTAEVNGTFDSVSARS